MGTEEQLISLPEIEPASILHPGPTALGVLGKTGATGFLLVMGFGLYRAMLAFVDAVGPPAIALMFVIMIGYAFLATIVGQWVWRPARSFDEGRGPMREHAVAVDPALEQRVDRRLRAKRAE